jgi:hypothetical protein
MRLAIDLNEKLTDIQAKLMVYPEIIEQSRKQVTSILDGSIFSFFEMTVAEFLQLQENKMPQKIDAILKNPKTSFKTYLQILNTFEKGTKAFENVLEKTTIEQSMDDRIASNGLLELTPEESMLNFVKDFFNLHNFEEAQKITIYEYIIAKKIHFNSMKFQKNMTELQKNRL